MTHTLEQPCVLRAQPRLLPACARQFLSEDGHDRAQALQAFEQLLEIGLPVRLPTRLLMWFR
jgi:hypothetical protein